MTAEPSNHACAACKSCERKLAIFLLQLADAHGASAVPFRVREIHHPRASAFDEHVRVVRLAGQQRPLLPFEPRQIVGNVHRLALPDVGYEPVPPAEREDVGALLVGIGGRLAAGAPFAEI